MLHFERIVAAYEISQMDSTGHFGVHGRYHNGSKLFATIAEKAIFNVTEIRVKGTSRPSSRSGWYVGSNGTKGPFYVKCSPPQTKTNIQHD